MITELTFEQETRDGWIRRSAILSRPEQQKIHLWIEVPERYKDWLAPHEDPLLRLAIFYIMQQDGECRIHAEIDRILLENLTENMRVWQLWCPEKYHCPTLIPDAITDRKQGDNRHEAICAFSGGVDGSYALLAHKARAHGDLSLDISTAVMIHGADTPLEKQAEYDASFAKAEAALRELGVELIPARVNSRRYPHVWGHSFSAAVNAALSLFEGRFCRGIFASDEIASRKGITNQIGHGSNFITCRLFNSSSFASNMEGSNVRRPERCGIISRYPGIVRQLLVCWMAEQAGNNCGLCKKCLRTLLGFMAAGYKGELPFEQALTIKNLRKISLNKAHDRDDFMEILLHDEKTHALPDDVRNTLRSMLAKHAPDTLGVACKMMGFKLVTMVTTGATKRKYQGKYENLRSI